MACRGFDPWMLWNVHETDITVNIYVIQLSIEVNKIKFNAYHGTKRLQSLLSFDRKCKVAALFKTVRRLITKMQNKFLLTENFTLSVLTNIFKSHLCSVHLKSPCVITV